MLAGRVPSALAPGTTTASSTLDPRRLACTSGGAGSLTSGGSGGPFFPHAAVLSAITITINAEIAEIAENSKLRLLRDLCVDCSPPLRLTECTATDLRS